MEWIVILFGVGFGALVFASLTSKSNKEWTQLHQLYPGDSSSLKPKNFTGMKLGEGYAAGCIGLAIDNGGVLITSRATRTTIKQPLYIPHSEIQFTSRKTPTVPPMQILRIRNAPNIEIAFTKKWTDKIKEFQQGNGEVRKKAGGKD